MPRRELDEPTLDLERTVQDVLRRRSVLQPKDADIVDSAAWQAGLEGTSFRCDTEHRELMAQCWPEDEHAVRSTH